MIEQAENVTKKHLNELTPHEKEIRQQIEHLVKKPLSQLTPREKELKWQIENIIKIEEDSKRLNVAENSINIAKLNEITSTNAVENDYSDLQIEAKPRKKAQEQKHGVGNERKFFTNSKTGIANDAHLVFCSKKFNDGTFMSFSLVSKKKKVFCCIPFIWIVQNIKKRSLLEPC